MLLDQPAVKYVYLMCFAQRYIMVYTCLNHARLCLSLPTTYTNGICWLFYLPKITEKRTIASIPHSSLRKLLSFSSENSQVVL